MRHQRLTRTNGRTWAGTQCIYALTHTCSKPRTTRFLSELRARWKIVFKTGERKASEWMYQRISVAVMRGNAASIVSCTPDQVKVHPHSQCDALVHKVVVGVQYMVGCHVCQRGWGWHDLRYRLRARTDIPWRRHLQLAFF